MKHSIYTLENLKNSIIHSSSGEQALGHTLEREKYIHMINKKNYSFFSLILITIFIHFKFIINQDNFKSFIFNS